MAWAQVTGVNPPVGSVWTYLGATYGAGWVFPTSQFPIPQCKADGVADNTGCVQAAISNLCPTNGGTLLIPAGRWKFHDITVNCDGVHIIGAGIGGPSGWGGVTNSGTNNATFVDCSGLTSYCIHFTPSGFPAQTRLSGGSVEKIAFYNPAGSSVGTVVGFDQVTAGYIRDVSMWQAPNAVRIFGAFHFVASNVQTWATNGVAWDVSGSMTGKTLAGAACTLGDCSTRTDGVVLNDLYGTQAATGTFVYIHDQAFTVEGEHLLMENGLYGLRVTCAAGQPNLSYCPQQIIFRDFETEFSLHPYALSDFTWFRCIQCYGAGITTSVPFSGPSYTDSIIKLSLVNYPIIGGAGGGAAITDGEFFGSSASCIDVGVTDTKLSGNDINGCNGASTTFGGIEFRSGTQHRASDNGFCSGVNAAPFVMTGIVIDSGADHVQLANNSYFNCDRNVVNNSSLGFSVYETNPSPPNSSNHPVTISGATGIGTGGTATVNGNDLGGSILLTAGTGAAATGSIQINFGQKMFPQVQCVIQPVSGSGTWTSPTTIDGIISVSTSFQFNWHNAAALTSSLGYFLFYQCRGY